MPSHAVGSKPPFFEARLAGLEAVSGCEPVSRLLWPAARIRSLNAALDELDSPTKDGRSAR